MACVTMADPWLHRSYGEQEHRASRLEGHLHFYRTTQIFRRLPLATFAIGTAMTSLHCHSLSDLISTLGNALLLGYMCFFPTDKHTSFSRQAIAQAVVVLEALVALPWYLLYLCTHTLHVL